jgi:YfiH family protein
MNQVEQWLVPDWPAPAHIHAVMTLRTGGVSEGVFNSLNVAAHVGDDDDRVRQNRQLVKDSLVLPSEPVWLEQIHSNRVVNAANTPVRQQADASYTDTMGIVCAVMTADCLPILICTVDGSQVAAIHAGWRGLLAGIISNTIVALKTRTVLVWLGAAIGFDCFEVGAEVRDAFIAKSADFAPAFKPKINGKWLADIYQLARIDFAALGITAIYGGDFCTMTDEVRFYSYRRDKETGRMASLIWRQ